MINYNAFYKILITLWICSFSISEATFGQLLHRKLGNPIIQTFSPEEYKSHQDILSIVQDKNGLMYFGTYIDLVMFDGMHWLRIPTPDDQPVFSMSIDSQGTVYAGLAKDFGCIQADTLGQPRFVSLLPKIQDKKHQQISAISKIFSTRDGIYFISKEKIFRYYKNEIKKVWVAQSQENFTSTYSIGNQVYICKKQGIYQLHLDKIRPIKELSSFRSVHTLMPQTNQNVLIIDHNKGVWKYFPKTQKVIRVKQSLTKKIKETSPYLMYCLSDSLYALGIQNKGIMIIDSQGNVRYQLGKEQGLASNNINCLYTSQNNLWIGTVYGISRVTINTPLGLHNEKTGINNITYDIKAFRSKVYLALPKGVFVTNDEGKMEAVSGIQGPCSNLCYFRDKLLANNDQGIYEIKGAFANKIINAKNTIYLKAVDAQSDKLYISTTQGISIWQQAANQWTEVFNKSFNPYILITDIATDQKKRRWITTSYKGVGIFDQAKVTLLDTLYGSVALTLPSLFKYQGQVYFNTMKGISIFDEANNRFKPDRTFEKLLDYKKGRISHIVTDPTYRYWAVKDVKTGTWTPYVKTNSNIYKPDTLSFQFIKKTTSYMQVYSIDTDGTYWIYTPSLALYSYNPQQKLVLQHQFSTLIRQVKTANDSLLFAGYGQPIPPVLAYENNTVVLKYTSTFYEQPQKTLYSYYLAGYHAKWSKWTNETKKEYTNLPEGTYTFQVKSRNIYGIESNIATYQFTILPPWYRTWWAYLIFCALGMTGLWLIIKAYTYRIQQQKLVLERKIKERTTEISAKNQEITTQNEELYQQKEEIIAQRDAIQKQHRLLDYQNQQIKQSIKAALTIQEAVLPFASRLKQTLGSYFIIYRPKAVVSGDFFWLGQIENKKIIGVVDCTGHGVPGAFMSLIGITLLNEIIKTNQVTEPSQILEKLRTRIHYALRQDESGNQNGMDAIFVTIEGLPDKTHHKVSFAGAKRPFWYIEERANQLKEIKGSPVSIGIAYHKNRAIQQTTFLLEKNTLIYLGSDGFVDQNNKNRERFGNVHLQDLLFKVRQQSFDSQKQILEDALDKHMEGTEQRDDILFLGFKL